MKRFRNSCYNEYNLLAYKKPSGSGADVLIRSAKLALHASLALRIPPSITTKKVKQKRFYETSHRTSNI